MKRLLFAASAAILISGCVPPYNAAAETVYFQADTQEELADVLSEAILLEDPAFEVGAFMYCTEEKGCWSSELINGSSTGLPAIPVYSAYSPADTDNMVGFIHSHPKSAVLGQTINVSHLLDELNKAPSLQDYIFMSGLGTEGLVNQELTLYILGPDQNTRGYVVPRPTLN